jgi:hypothetical protein
MILFWNVAVALSVVLDERWSQTCGFRAAANRRSKLG